MSKGNKFAPWKKRGLFWTDIRRAETVRIAKTKDLFKDTGLDDIKLNELYDIVVAENENWDGEDMDCSNIAGIMAQRYMKHGLAPSRN